MVTSLEKPRNGAVVKTGLLCFNIDPLSACTVLLPNDFKQTTRYYCENCAKLRKSTIKTTLAPVVDGGRAQLAPTKRESFMSEDDLKEKLHQERTRRINSEQREQYLGRK